MKKIILYFVLIAVSYGCSEDNNTIEVTEEPFNKNVKVMTFNIHNGFPRGSNTNDPNDYDLNGIIQTIKNSDAEIIGLNEISNGHKKATNYEDQSKIIGKALGYNYDFYGLEVNGKFGVGILCKYPILETNHVKYKIQGEHVKGILEAKIQHPDGNLWVYITHLESGVDNSVRLTEIQELIYLSSKRNGPKLILGDLNFTPDSNEHELIIDSEFIDPRGKSLSPNTFKLSDPKRIDYILGNEYVIFVKKPWSDTSNTASDHFPVWADITINF